MKLYQRSENPIRKPPSLIFLYLILTFYLHLYFWDSDSAACNQGPDHLYNVPLPHFHTPNRPNVRRIKKSSHQHLTRSPPLPIVLIPTARQNHRCSSTAAIPNLNFDELHSTLHIVLHMTPMTNIYSISFALLFARVLVSLS